MQYVSTRDISKTPVDFKTAVQLGLAPDGGLYVPASWPKFSPEKIESLRGVSYQQIAHQVISPLVGKSIANPVLWDMINDAHSPARFGSKEITPLVRLKNGIVIQELSHGPTIAFKDVALQLLGPIFSHFLGHDDFMTILGATSGDTGSAAEQGCAGRPGITTFILHPHNRTSEIQRRQMTTNLDPSVFNIAIKGTFDDAQAIVKKLFGDPDFKAEYKLGAINSINWARIMAQTVYYAYSSLKLGTIKNPVDYSVPTGNFGDIFAGYAAKRMGFPIGKLIMATNENDILHRFRQTGEMVVADKVIETDSPSMDIGISSNHERVLYFYHGTDAAKLRADMDSLKRTGRFSVDSKVLHDFGKTFLSERMSNNETLTQIRCVHKAHDYLMDPHTAVGYGAAVKLINAGAISSKNLVCMQTADPAKFPDAVQKATGVIPPLPAHLADIMEREERYVVLENDPQAVKQYIIQHALKAKAGRLGLGT